MFNKTKKKSKLDYFFYFFKIKMSVYINSQDYWPEKNNTQLYPHQIDAITWMKHMEDNKESFILGDVMGLGKTLDVCMLCELNLKKKTLIVVPKSTIYQWLRQLLITCKSCNIYLINDHEAQEASFHHKKIVLGDKFGVKELNDIDGYKICVCTYHAVKPYPAVGETDEATAKQVELGEDYKNSSKYLCPFKKIKWNRVIADEVHKLRNGKNLSIDKKGFRKKTLLFYRMNRLRMKSNGIRIGLSGTPIQNKISDLASLFVWLNINIPRGIKEDKLIELCHKYMFRRTEKDLHHILKVGIKFPLKNYIKEDIIVKYKTPEEKQFYELATTSLVGGRISDVIQHLYPKIYPEEIKMVLLQFLRYLSADIDMFIRIHNRRHDLDYPLWSGSESKLDMIEEKVKELSAKKLSCIIFIHFYEEAEKIEMRVSNLGYTIFHLNGNTTAQDREFILFQSRRKINKGKKCLVIANINSSAEGLNMQMYNHIIIATPDWNPQAEQQAIGRAHRIGNSEQVYVYRYLHAPIERLRDISHIDEYIRKMQLHKSEINDRVINTQKNAAYFWPRTLLPGTNEYAIQFEGEIRKDPKKKIENMREARLRYFQK